MSFTEANTIEHYRYHKPDTRWEIFGASDFQSYVDKFVIKGLFHKAVPEAVIESYEVAEYVMAHSWYHYPLYDEALSKLLRITEMAIKLRCKELNIEVSVKKKSGKERKKTFDELIDDYCAQEHGKGLKDQLHRARRIRNSFMHPEQHSYGLGFLSNPIRQIVNVLNALFLPQELFVQIKHHLRRIRNHLKQFEAQPLVLNYQGKRYLIAELRITKGILLNGQWKYCLAAIPVVRNTEEQLKTHSYTLPLCFEIENLELKKDGCTASEIADENSISIQITNHPDNEHTYHAFIKAKQEANEHERWFFDNFQDEEIYKFGSAFVYKYQHLFAS